MGAKERLFKTMIPALLEKFEPQLQKIIDDKNKMPLNEGEEDIVLILHIVNTEEIHNQLYASIVVIGFDSCIKRTLEVHPVKDFLLKLSNAK